MKYVRQTARHLARQCRESYRWGLEAVAGLMVNGIMREYPEVFVETFGDYSTALLTTIDDAKLEEFAAAVSELLHTLRAYDRRYGQPERTVH